VLDTRRVRELVHHRGIDPDADVVALSRGAGPMYPNELRALLIVKVRIAIAAVKSLILSDAWDLLTTERQRAVSEAIEGMREGVDRLGG